MTCLPSSFGSRALLGCPFLRSSRNALSCPHRPFFVFSMLRSYLPADVVAPARGLSPKVLPLSFSLATFVSRLVISFPLLIFPDPFTSSWNEFFRFIPLTPGSFLRCFSRLMHRVPAYDCPICPFILPAYPFLFPPHPHAFCFSRVAPRIRFIAHSPLCYLHFYHVPMSSPPVPFGPGIFLCLF